MKNFKVKMMCPKTIITNIITQFKLITRIYNLIGTTLKRFLYIKT